MVCVNKGQQLRELVIRLIEKENSVLPENYLEQIDEILDSNDLTLDESIPEWIVSFFANIVGETQSEQNKFIFKEEGQGDVYNFLAELEDILEMKCDDYGEDITMYFKKSNMIGYISVECSFWSTVRSR